MILLMLVGLAVYGSSQMRNSTQDHEGCKHIFGMFCNCSVRTCRLRMAHECNCQQRQFIIKCVDIDDLYAELSG